MVVFAASTRALDSSCSIAAMIQPSEAGNPRSRAACATFRLTSPTRRAEAPETEPTLPVCGESERIGSAAHTVGLDERHASELPVGARLDLLANAHSSRTSK
jgi:hypothetical protein